MKLQIKFENKLPGKSKLQRNVFYANPFDEKDNKTQEELMLTEIVNKEKSKYRQHILDYFIR